MTLNRRDFALASLSTLGAFALGPAQAATSPVNRRIVLASRPVGAPTLDNFALESVPVPKPGDGELLLRTKYLSLDPYMRGRMCQMATI